MLCLFLAVVCLWKEMWNCPCSTDVFAQFAEDFDDKDSALSFKMLSEVACKEGITIVGGSIPEWSGGELYNTCCVFAPNGELLAKHRKVRIYICVSGLKITEKNRELEMKT